VDEIPLVDYSYDYGKHRYIDPAAKVLDYQDFREWSSYHYFKPQIAAIRRADPRHMVTISNHMRPPGGLWEGAAQYFIGLSEPEEIDLVDYMTHHDNHDATELKDANYAALARGVVVRSRACFSRKIKPIILEEFAMVSPQADQVVQACSEIVRQTVGSCSGWMVWFFQHPDVGNPTGLADHDMQPTAWGQAFRDLGAPGGLIHTSDLSWQKPKQVIEMNREQELVPTRMGTLGQVDRNWDQYQHPVSYRWPHSRWLGLKIPRPE
jgi:hypothetical protein